MNAYNVPRMSPKLEDILQGNHPQNLKDINQPVVFLHMQVFIYEGSLKCLEFPFVILLVLGIIFLFMLGIALPLYILYLIYQPQVMSNQAG